MNATILAWTLMMGGVLIPGAEPTEGPPSGTASQGPLVDIDLLTTEPSGLGSGTDFSVPRPSPAGVPSAAGAGQSFSPFPQPEVPQVNSPTGLDFGPVPFAPTDPGAASGYPWGPPTAGDATDNRAQGQSSGGGASSSALAPRLSGSGGYLAPRAAPPTYQPQTTYSPLNTQQSRMAPSPSTSPSAKPFQGYTQPSAVSPYMALGRIQSVYDDTDTYNQYVRPRLEEMQSQTMATELRGLHHSVQALGRETTSVRGMAIPHYYMNYGGYYPSLQR